MAGIFQAKCDTCGAESEHCPDFWLAVRMPDGNEEVLTHPSEGRRLEELGLTWEQVKRDGTLKRYAATVCEKCAGLVSHDDSDPRLRQNPGWGDRIGCFALLACFLAGALGGQAFPGPSWSRALAGIGLGLVGCAVGIGLLLMVNRVWRRLRPETVSFPKSEIVCPACNSGHLHLLGSVVGLGLPCPSCASLEYSFRCWMIS